MKTMGRFFQGQSNEAMFILSRASEAGSPTNRLGSDKKPDEGSFGPSTGGPDLHGSLQTTLGSVWAATRHGVRDPFKKKQTFLLRQGEPGTSHYFSKKGGLFYIFFPTKKGSTLYPFQAKGGPCYNYNDHYGVVEPCTLINLSPLDLERQTYLNFEEN